MMTELSNCPFCGSPVRFNFNMELIPDGIMCYKCKYVLRYWDIKGKNTTKFGELMGAMAERWNRRATNEEFRRACW